MNLRPSAWKYNTSAGLGASNTTGIEGLGPISITAGGGHLLLTNPVNNRDEKFYYYYLGAGPGLSLGDNQMRPKNIQGALERTWSEGTIWMAETFRGKELAATDFEGLCIIQDVSWAAAYGKARTMFTLGLSVTALPGAAFKTGWLSSLLDYDFFDDLLGPGGSYLKNKLFHPSGPNAVMFTRSHNAGFQLGLSASQSLGIVTRMFTPPVPAETPQFSDGPGEKVDNRSSTVQQEELVVPADVLFDFGDPNLKQSPPAAKAATERVSERVASRIRAKPPQLVEIWGHTDSIEHHPGINQPLSKARAESVRRWLVSRNIVDPSKVLTKGFAATQPVAANNTKEGRAQNRRVEIRLSF